MIKQGWQTERVETSGTSLLFGLCFVAVIAAALQSVAPLIEDRVSLRHISSAGWTVWLCVAIPSLMQIPFPGVYDALHRDATLIIDGHQWWRLITSVMVQDGGIAGTASNLFLLALTLTLSLRLWGSVATVVTFVGAGIGLNILASTLGAADGGGNSGATVLLLASLPPFALATLPKGHRWRGVAACVVTAVAALALIAADDAHGIAVGLGLVLGVAGMRLASRHWDGQLDPGADAR